MSNSEIAALLSMDVYTREYGANGKTPWNNLDIDDLLPENANIVWSSQSWLQNSNDPNVPDSDEIFSDPDLTSFHAIAYEINGEIFLTYRGTDDRDVDEATGWAVGKGVIAVLN